MRALNRQSSERAAVLFLLAVIVVPLLLILSTAWFDLQKFSTERSELQTKVDLAVTQAAAQLPYSYLATRVAHQALSAQGISASKVIVQPGSVEITVEADSKLIFAPFIGLSMSQEELKKLAMDLSSIHYSVSARATSTRKVALIYLDTGHYLAPEIDDPSNEAWGDLGRDRKSVV